MINIMTVCNFIAFYLVKASLASDRSMFSPYDIQRMVGRGAGAQVRGDFKIL
jgi:hypothetical protein